MMYEWSVQLYAKSCGQPCAVWSPPHLNRVVGWPPAQHFADNKNCAPKWLCM